MKSIIMCEGKTDAILLSYFLVKTYGWQFTKKIKFNLKLQSQYNTSQNWYINGDNTVLIVGVGGKDCFNNSIKEVLKYNSMDSKNAFEKIIIMTDRDSNINNDVILSGLVKEFLIYDKEFILKNNSWECLSIMDDFGEKINIDITALIIPFEKEGALETFLIEALREDQDKALIIDKVREFIINLNSNTYLKKDRLKLKAELSIILSIISPEKVFSVLDELILSIPWERYTKVQEVFSIFENLI